jgi:hypothetical protein
LRKLLQGLLGGEFEDIDGQPAIIPSREALETDAEELKAIGLPEVAMIVAEAAEKAIPAHILECPYDAQDACNYIAWHRR